MSSQLFSQPLRVKIYLHPQAGAIAEGGDELARMLLARAGFVPDNEVAPGAYGLPTRDAELVAMAVARAARMLRVAEYVMTISPELKSLPNHSARRWLSEHATITIGVEELSDDLRDCNDLADVARLADQIFNEGEGVLVSVEDFATQAAHLLASFDTEEAGAVADKFLSIARRLDTVTAVYGLIGEDLLDLHEAALGT
jgi:hypothetical protein